MLSARNLPSCLVPMLIDGMCKNGASIIPLLEFPINTDAYFMG